VGRDLGADAPMTQENQFQSTRPVWGATEGQDVDTLPTPFQSTRPVWGATGAWGS